MRNKATSFSLLDRICDGAIVFNGEGGILYMNSTAEKILGCTFEEVAGRNVYEVVVVDYTDSTGAGDAFSMDNNAMRNRFFLTTRTGGRIPVTFSVSQHAGAGDGMNDTILMIRIEIEQFKIERELEESMENLRKTIKGVVHAIENTIAQRDPYTAGHQRRVSTISRKIGQVMGLSNNVVESIRLAGMMHDIGKISIPAEILAKPCSLISAEYELIKTHPQKGHEILKMIDFPWPIAENVFQHHERIDGSGYPRGLKGEEIKIEARIIAVADVVEAIASHRPYRAALGIDAAIAEIQKHRTRLYDPDVVDACVDLLKDSQDSSFSNSNPLSPQ